MTQPGDENDDRTRAEATEISGDRRSSAERDAEALARIGGYRLIELLGQGGMGSVWLAEQTEPVQRKVALKLLQPSALDGIGRALFEVERQMLAQMSHPCIAQVFDAGTTDDGQPWFAMEWVPGEPITDYADHQGLDTTARLRLLIRICQGVQHAHERGIIHRDLKPANVLVCALDDDHLPKIIDFGVATSVYSEGGTLRANSSDRAGTRAYMSPEQYAEDAGRLDTRSDVYALGVVLFELLTGTRPPSSDDFEALSTFHTGLGGEPERRRASDPAAAEALAAAQGLDSELRCILARAMAPNRDQRYSSAAELSQELERHLAGEVVQAVPSTRRYRWGKFIRRHRVALGAGSLVVLALIGGLALALWGLLEAQAERDRAQLAAERAEQTSAFVTNMLDSIDPEYARGADTALMRRVLDDAALRAREELADQPDILAEIALTIGGAYFSIGEDTAASEHLERAEALSRDRNDLVNLNLRASLLLSALEARLGQFDPAIERARELLERAEATLPTGDRLRLEARAQLANALQSGGDPDAAEPILRAVIAATEDPEGPDLLNLRLESLRALAQVQSDRMELEQAHATYEQVLGESAGSDDPSIGMLRLYTLNDRAVAYLRQQRYADGEPLLRETLDRKRELFGDRHPMTLTAASNLAGSLRQQGRPEEALPFYEQVLDDYVALYGEAHPRSLIARHNFGNGMLDVGRPHESIVLHREALEGARQTFADNEFLIGNFELGLGKSELALGNAETALALLESAERLISDSTGADHHRAEEAREYAAQARTAIQGAGELH